MKDTYIETYQDKRGGWRWRVTHTNGKVIGSSSQGYARHIDAVRNMAALGIALRPASGK